MTLKPHKGERETLEIKIPIPRDFPEGPCELVVCDATNSVRRQFRNDPAILEPRDLDALIRAIRLQTDPKRTSVYLHIPSPERGCAIKGQALPNLPGSVRSAFASKRETPMPPIRERHHGGAAGELGRGRDADAAIYGGQRCRVVVIVVSLRRSASTDSTTTRNEMSDTRSCHSTRIRIFADMDRGDRVGRDRVAGGHGPAPRSKPGVRKARARLPRPIAKGWWSPITAGSGSGMRWLRWDRSASSGSGTWRGRAKASCWRPPAMAARSLAASPKPARAGASFTIVRVQATFQASDTQVLSLVVTPDGHFLRGHRPERPGREPDRSQASGFAA